MFSNRMRRANAEEILSQRKRHIYTNYFSEKKINKQQFLIDYEKAFVRVH